MTMKVPPEYRDRPLIGSEVPWKKIWGELLRVIRFVRLGNIDMDSKSTFFTWSWAMVDFYDRSDSGYCMPVAHYLDFRRSLYALLEVECPPRLNTSVYLPVRHRVDFFKACIYLDPLDKIDRVAPDEEVLVGGPLVMEGLAKKVLRPFMPRLGFSIHPKGYLEWQYGFRERGGPPPGGWLWRPRWQREAQSERQGGTPA